MFDLVLPWFLVNFAKFLNRIFLRVISGWLLVNSTGQFLDYLTLSWRGSLSYRNQFIDFEGKSMDWFLYDRDLRLEWVIEFLVYAITFRFVFVAHHKILCNQPIYIWICHCVKSVQIRSFFWSVFSIIQSECGKIRTRKTSVFGHFSRSV